MRESGLRHRRAAARDLQFFGERASGLKSQGKSDILRH
jgi:hypothetical protein